MSEKEIIFYSAVIGFVLGALIMFFVMKDDMLEPESSVVLIWDGDKTQNPKEGDTIVVEDTEEHAIFLSPKK